MNDPPKGGGAGPARSEVGVDAEDPAHPAADGARRLDAPGHGTGGDGLDPDGRTLGHPAQVRREPTPAEALHQDTGQQLGLLADGQAGGPGRCRPGEQRPHHHDGEHGAPDCFPMRHVTMMAHAGGKVVTGGTKRRRGRNLSCRPVPLHR